MNHIFNFVRGMNMMLARLLVHKEEDKLQKLKFKLILMDIFMLIRGHKKGFVLC